jgi:hypothetical protein
MLTKSKKSTVIMAFIFILSTITIDQIIFALTNTGTGANDTVFYRTTFSFIILYVGIAAFLIYGLDESHFGVQGAIRWAAMGIIYTLLTRTHSWILQSYSQNAFICYDWLLLLCASYWIVFKCSIFAGKKSNDNQVN